MDIGHLLFQVVFLYHYTINLGLSIKKDFQHKTNVLPAIGQH